MALQDVCGFQDTPAYPRWNAPASLSMPVGDTILHFETGIRSGIFDFRDMNSAGRKSRSPLELYIPVPGYLTQSPFNFGQISPNTLASQPPPFQSPTPLSPSCLPISIPLSSSPFSLSPSVPLPFSMCHGTTTLAFAFQGGAIAAADTRSSCGGLVACPASHKVLPVHSHMVGTTSGTSADCALWKRILARECRLYQLRNRRRLTVEGSAKLLSQMLHPFKGTELCVAATLCGWDGEDEEAEPAAGQREALGGAAQEQKEEAEQGREDMPTDGDPSLEEMSLRYIQTSKNSKQNTEESKQALDLCTDPRAGEADKNSVSRHVNSFPRIHPATAVKGTQDGGPGNGSSILPISTSKGASGRAAGPRLCYVCSDGTLLKGKVFSVGSGSPYAYSVLDVGLRWDLSVAEACSVAREAVFRATHRDAYSGNCVDLFHITSRGWRRREREDLKEEYYREKERERERLEERRRQRENVEQRKESQS